jgi:CRISPR-associated endonuclease/helicase Cas3
VFRALAGLETLAQAAGRCNREMKGKEPGRFYVFRAPSQPPAGSLRLGMHVALDSYFQDGDPDLNDPHLFPKYARQVLKLEDIDGERVMEPESECDFPCAAERFRMIDDAGVPVVAPYGEAMAYVGRLRREKDPRREDFRRLQRFTVSLRPRELDRLFALGFLEPVFKGASVTSPEDRRGVLWTVRENMPVIYDGRFGFGWEAGERFEPGHLIV